MNPSHTQAPQLIIACACTGKTATITARIAYMVEKENIDHSRILALTLSKDHAGKCGIFDQGTACALRLFGGILGAGY